MISAAFKALSDVLSPDFRAILWKAIGLTLLLFAAILVAIEAAISILAAFPWPWLETVVAIATGLGVFAAFFFLMGPVTALFAGFFLDRVAEIVETRDYPADPPGRPLAGLSALVTGIQFGLLVLLVNLLTLPFLFFGIGALVMWATNAYLLGREYFGMIATRHMPPRDAALLRKANGARVFAAGLIPAGLALVPVLNIIVPLFSTAYFVHIFKIIAAPPRP